MPINGGLIIGGRNRYATCEKIGIEPLTRPYAGPDLVSYVISLNLRRRHLDESQCALVAAKLATLQLGSNQYSTKTEDAQICVPISQPDAAKLVNVSRRAVQHAAAVRSQAGPLKLGRDNCRLSRLLCAKITRSKSWNPVGG
jgi:hypothetical protein